MKPNDVPARRILTPETQSRASGGGADGKNSGARRWMIARGGDE